MNGNLRHYSDDVWDRFFEFVMACDKSLSRGEVQAELKRRGIDAAPAFARVKEALEAVKARESLANARDARMSSLSKLQTLERPKGHSLRETLQGFIGRLAGQKQAAYFHKLEKAATESDLQSLLEDLHRLDDFETDLEDGRKSGQ